MNLRNIKNWQHSRILKSLLLIIGLQLVVLQVKALTTPVSMDHKPCSEMAMSHQGHFQRMDTVSENEQQTAACPHCIIANIDCQNGCNTASLITFLFYPVLGLINIRKLPPSPAINDTFIGVSSQPSLKPPRLLIV